MDLIAIHWLSQAACTNNEGNTGLHKHVWSMHTYDYICIYRYYMITVLIYILYVHMFNMITHSNVTEEG